MGTADLTIRAAGDSDRAALEALIAECYASVYPGWYGEEVLGDALPAMLRIDPALLGSGRYLLASMGDDLAGCGGWSIGVPKSGEVSDGIGHVRHFATRTDLMGKGVGGAILDRCVAEASHAGMSKLRCFSSLPAEQFYARHGFSKLGDVNVMLGEGVYFPAVQMEKALISN
jgi:GNAT superfamily N-acetyltransferase